jgi:hypothetical protein
MAEELNDCEVMPFGFAGDQAKPPLVDTSAMRLKFPSLPNAASLLPSAEQVTKDQELLAGNELANQVVPEFVER